MTALSTWHETAADNDAASPDGFPEGMAPSGVNNSAREVMAAVRSFYNSMEWRDWGHTISFVGGTQFGTAGGDGDTTDIYHVGRRVHANGAVTGDIYGEITVTAHSGTTTVTVAWDSGALVNEALTIEVGFSVAEQSIGVDAIPPSIEATTAMVFYQAAAPTGWTKSVAHNDKALRVVSGAGGGAGGTHGLSSPPSTAHVHTGPSHVHAGPSHNHMWYDWINTNNGARSYASNGSFDLSWELLGGTGGDKEALMLSTGSPDQELQKDQYTSNAGTGSTGAGGTANTGSGSPTAFAPDYIDVIVCTKD